MHNLATALKNAESQHSYIIRKITNIDTEKPEHPVSFLCDEINEYRQRFEDNFDVIVYVAMWPGFYVLPYRILSKWFTESNITVDRTNDTRVWRLFFKKPHLFRATNLQPLDWEDMGSYFYDSERMGDWVNAHVPEIEQTKSHFTWVPIYRQIAEKVLQYRDRQGELIAIFKKLRNEGIHPIPLEDKISDHESVPLEVIDPFTVFASFNVSRKTSQKSHEAFCRTINEIQKALGLEIRKPEDFDGVNTISHKQTWFFGDKGKGRKDDDIPLLWDLAEAIFEKRNDRIAELFPKCLGIQRIAGPKLSTGLTWFDPENYIALSEKTIFYFKQKLLLTFTPKIWFKCRNSSLQDRETAWHDYMDFIQQVREKTSDSFVKIAHAAYNTKLDPTKGPTVEEYVSAIQALLENGTLNDNIKKCLAALNEKPLTMTELSQLLGYKKAARLSVGIFGKSMCEVLAQNKTPYQQIGVRIFASSIRDPHQNNEFVHTLRPNFRKALEKFLTADWKLPLQSVPELPPNPQDIKFFRQVDDILKHKKQVIIFGPPGTGKTFLADKYVTFKSGSRENEFVVRCTFHPEYGYEHFIEGFKPEVSKGQMTFVPRVGVFKRICQTAGEEKNKDKKYYLIIDEINRGDIPRIFGELITLIEVDKRGKFKAKLPHTDDDFTVPENVYIIATMNTADRSIALLDTALRRRFGFLEMEPDYAVLGDQKVGEIHLGDFLKKLNKKLVEELMKIRNDVRHIKIGHSYLMSGSKPIHTQDQLNQIVRHEILPLLEEYCYEEHDVYRKLKQYVEDSLEMSGSSQNDVSGQAGPSKTPDGLLAADNTGEDA